MFRPEDFAELFLRLRPIGLALRATPSAALRRLRAFLLMPQPPLLFKEGNMLACNSFTPSRAARLLQKQSEIDRLTHLEISVW